MGGSHYWPTYNPKPTPERPVPPKEPSETEQRLLRDYQNLRLDITAVEEVLGVADSDLSEAERKRLDKAVVLMRVGAKLVKRTLRERGFLGRLKAPHILRTAPQEQGK